MLVLIPRSNHSSVIFFHVRIQNTTDAMAAQFFLKNVHPDMRSAAIELFGEPELHSRPNVFGELMRVLILPSAGIEAAVKSVLANAEDPDMALHMRMLMNRLADLYFCLLTETLYSCFE